MASRWSWLLIAVGVVAAGAAISIALWPDDRPVGGDETTTPRSLAYVVAEHVDLSPTKAGVDWSARSYRRLFPHPDRAVAAAINFAGEGNIVVVSVSPEQPKQAPFCDDGLCADLGTGITLSWDELSPEEDPGLVVITARVGGHTVVLRYSGPEIDGDPRNLDLPVSIDTLVDIATDPRIAPTTSQEAVDAGEQVDYWLDGNPVI